MTAYPALGFDPAPGDPLAVDELQRTVARVADRIGSANTQVRRLGHSDGVWQGQGAQAFARRVGDLPKHLGDAETSMQGAVRALGRWSVHLVDFQRRAAAYELQAEAATQAVNAAKASASALTKPDSGATDAQKADAVDKIHAAQSKVNAAGDELERILALARSLRDEHSDLAESVARTLRDASDVAPNKPGFFSRLGSALSDAMDFVVSLPGKAGQWIKDHADLIAVIGDVLSDISTVLAIVATVCMFIPPLEAVSGVLFIAAAGFAGGALVAHSVAKAGGADVSWGTIALDAVGVVTGAVGKGAEVAIKGAQEMTALGKVADAALLAEHGSPALISGYTAIGGETLVRAAQVWKGSFLVGEAGVQLATWNPWTGNLYSDIKDRYIPAVTGGISSLSNVFVGGVGGAQVHPR